MSKQKIQLSDHFDYSRLLRFVLPCVGTMLFTSIYGIVDGLCVSNFVGKTAFAAVNLIMPVPMLVGTVGFMLGTGGSAIVGITLGEGDNAKADRYFSLFMSTALIAGIVLSVLGMLLLRPVAMMLGAEGEMLDYALRYGRVLMLSLPTFILQNMFQSVFCHRRKAASGLLFHGGRGLHQHGAGRAVGGHPALERGGCRHCHHAQPGGGRPAAGVLLPQPEQHQPAPPLPPAV